jgi:hypothetical protein
MALPLTVFQSLPLQVSVTPEVIYESPVGYNTIFLQAQVFNPDTQERTITLNYLRGSSSIALFQDYPIPAGEILYVTGTGGKLVLEPGDSWELSGSSALLTFYGSLLQTLK